MSLSSSFPADLGQFIESVRLNPILTEQQFIGLALRLDARREQVETTSGVSKTAIFEIVEAWIEDTFPPTSRTYTYNMVLRHCYWIPFPKWDMPPRPEGLLTVSEWQRWDIGDLEAALKLIDEFVDVEHDIKLGSGKLEYAPERVGSFSSAVVPRAKPLKTELAILEGIVTDRYITIEIKRDCDQIRAMIKIFCQPPLWPVDTFRLAMGYPVGPTRRELFDFLRARGTDDHQLQSRTFLMCCEFFDRRSKLGFPIRNAVVEKDSK